MLSGIYYPDEGQIYIDDMPVSIASPKQAFELGIGMIHQHIKLIDIFTAVQNIALGIKKKGSSSLKKVRKEVLEICGKYWFVIEGD